MTRWDSSSNWLSFRGEGHHRSATLIVADNYFNQLFRRHGRKPRRRSALERYGLTPESFGEMFVDRGGRCEICGATHGYRGRDLAIDHCHKTNVVRGLLCDRCNLMEGNVSPENGSPPLRHYLEFTSLRIAHESVLRQWVRSGSGVRKSEEIEGTLRRTH